MSHILVYFDTTSASPAPEYEGLVLYRISWLWYSAVCFGVTYVVGLIVSVLWRGKYQWRQASSETLIASRASRFLSRVSGCTLDAIGFYSKLGKRRAEKLVVVRLYYIVSKTLKMKIWKKLPRQASPEALTKNAPRVVNRGNTLCTLTLKMTTAQVVETSVTVNNNSPIQDYIHPPRRSYSTYFWNDSWVPTFHSFTVSKVVLTVYRWSPVWWGWFATAIQNKILLTGLCIEETAKNTGRPTTSGWRRGKLLLLRKIIFQSVKQAARRKKSKYFQ